MPSATIEVKVKPRSRHDRIEATAAGIEIRVNAPPVDGKANARVVKLLAQRLAVPKSALSVAGGAGARIKRILIDGLGAAEVMKRLYDL